MDRLCPSILFAIRRVDLRVAFPLVIALLLLQPSRSEAQLQIDTRELSADIVRVLSKDLFDLNSVPFMQPMVETFNATSNAGFYQTAHVPKGDTFYFRIGLRGMFGFVRDDQKTFRPTIPTTETKNSAVSPIALLIANRVKTIFRKGVEEDSIRAPEQSATVLGFLPAEFDLNTGYLRREIKNDSVYKQAIALGLDSNVIDGILAGLPTALALPTGADLSTILAIVPQIEVGSLYGTEIMARFIPPIELDTAVGSFSFWGVGIKHSISQYFTEDFDLAAQVAIQGTSLENQVGVTNAKLDATASIIDANIHGSKRFGGLTLYSGLGLSSIDIQATYTYTLPRALQAQLGLITPKDLNGDGVITDDEFVADPEKGFPGDTKPQTSEVGLTDTSVQWTIGASYELGPARLMADFSLGKFSVFSVGLMAGF